MWISKIDQDKEKKQYGTYTYIRIVKWKIGVWYVCVEHVFIYPVELWPQSQIYVDMHIYTTLSQYYAIRIFAQLNFFSLLILVNKRDWLGWDGGRMDRIVWRRAHGGKKKTKEKVERKKIREIMCKRQHSSPITNNGHFSLLQMYMCTVNVCILCFGLMYAMHHSNGKQIDFLLR